jgi:hypothetical protein
VDEKAPVTWDFRGAASIAALAAAGPAAAAVTPALAAAAEAAGGVLLGLGLVHGECPAVVLLAIRSGGEE